MKKFLISIIFFVFCFISIGVVHALNINAPVITGVEYPNANSIKIKYDSKNTNSSYKVLVYNMTSGDLIKQDINTSSYTFTGLETGKVYNFKARVYYLNDSKPELSEWSNIVSASPKADSVTIKSLSAGNGQVVVNYSTTTSPAGVEIYVKELKKIYKTTNLTTYTITGLTNNKTYTITARTYYNNGATGDWSPFKTITLSPENASTVTLGKIKTDSKTITLNYTVKGDAKAVQIYVKELNKFYKTTNLKKYTKKGFKNGKKYKIKARTYITDTTYGPWTDYKTVKLPTWGEVIASTAEKLSWKRGTSTKIWVYHYGRYTAWKSWSQLGTSRPNKAFKNAYDKVRPNHFKLTNKVKATRVGASCDVFVGTVIRASGYDKKYPFGLQATWDNEPTKKRPKKWKKVKCTKKNLKRGDIIQFNRIGPGGHTFIWLGNNRIAEAGLASSFGHISKKSNPCDMSGKRKDKFIVRRAIG